MAGWVLVRAKTLLSRWEKKYALQYGELFGFFDTETVLFFLFLFYFFSFFVKTIKQKNFQFEGSGNFFLMSQCTVHPIEKSSGFLFELETKSTVYEIDGTKEEELKLLFDTLKLFQHRVIFFF